MASLKRLFVYSGIQMTRAKTLEETIGFWSKIEKEILEKPEEELKAEMLGHLEFICAHFGTPKQYYNFSNPSQDEINKRIDRLQDIRNVLLQNEEKTRKLFNVIVKANSKKESKDERNFAKFYMAIRESYLHFYGEPRLSVGGSTQGIFHPYSDLKHAAKWFTIHLEKGPSNVQDLIEKYSQQAGKQPAQSYTG